MISGDIPIRGEKERHILKSIRVCLSFRGIDLVTRIRVLESDDLFLRNLTREVK